MKNRVAFTLPQLLVTVAVGSLLTVAILPVLQSDHETLQRAICASNLREIGQAITLYANDNNDCFPPGYERSAATDWHLIIGPYLAKSQTTYASGGTRSPVFICPAAVLVPPSGTTISLTYSAHRWMFPDLPSTCSPPPSLPCVYHLGQCTRPSEVVMVTDGCQQSVASTTTFDALACLDGVGDCTIAYGSASANKRNQPEPMDPAKNVDGPNGIGLIRWRHYNNNGANFLMVDGHVQSFLGGQLLRRNLYYDQ